MNTLISTLKGGKEEFFALLWRRMSEKGDFPALSKSVQNLAEAMQDEDKSASELTAAILSDFALTQKVIRLANSAMYSVIGGEITTITKAAMVLGLDAISHLALSVRFMDTLSASTPDSEMARAEMAKALLAGDIARKIVGKANVKDSEEAVVCALMHHLGRLLLAFYFPEEWAKILEEAAGNTSAENAAAIKVIGVSLDEIAQEAARSWRLPGKIASSMLRTTAPDGTNIPGSAEWLRSVAGLSGEAAALVAEGGDKKAMSELASRYGDALLISFKDITDSVAQAAKDVQESVVVPVEEKKEEQRKARGKPSDARHRLSTGVHEMSTAQSEGMTFGNALNLVLETMYGAMGFNRVVAFLRDGTSFKARVGFGAMMPEALPQLIFPEAYATDVFHLALANNADVFIEDAAGVKTASSMPQWFLEALPDVQAFVLLPMFFNGRPVGLLYADWEKGLKEIVDQGELILLRSLRDHLMQTLSPKKG